ncbi:FemAB family PEP-CTERM system-associated protein [Aliiglaciecola sp. CAU 1673]|uniref:FemAB family XrtA/PEP-CTERM system-associated protein n=1 Tax=Aliiglaciecola sp. CAU 1673 TaxID=3032595 RepID=UPI0023DBB6A6|nr:FemAB family XrtA/PEP-CTERM system-associated protein [Aliiglaciecola sp. CAU 1673]MDF2177284.1 FemAB family PEP-CTERM system-associated protein [Aliiglaciecola sp. CAU 1673]
MSELLALEKFTGDADVAKAWDSFVEQCPDATFFHLSGWLRINQDVFGHKAHYLMAKQGAEIKAVLPLVEQRSKLFGHALISTPFCVYGGVAAVDESSKRFLEDAAIALAHELGVDYLELRNKEASAHPKLTERCAHSYFAWPLADNPDAILAGVKKKQRAVIRHSLKNGLSHRVDDDMQTAYDIYSESVRNLGTPVFPKHYFQALKGAFGERCDVLTVEHDGQSVSSVLNFYFRDQVLPYYGGGVPKARDLKSNDFMYYQLMCDAREKGYSHYDFGRSKNDSGAYQYKKHWGMEPTPLHYQFHLVKATELPNLSPNNPKYQLFIKLWQKLPLSVSRFMGPFLSKYLG